MKRIGLAVEQQALEEHFRTHIGYIAHTNSLQKYYNGAITSFLPVIVGHQPAELRPMRWGLIPAGWQSKTPPSNMETTSVNKIIQNRMLRKPIRSQRCIVPTSYYITWRNDQP